MIFGFGIDLEVIKLIVPNVGFQMILIENRNTDSIVCAEELDGLPADEKCIDPVVISVEYIVEACVRAVNVDPISPE